MAKKCKRGRRRRNNGVPHNACSLLCTPREQQSGRESRVREVSRERVPCRLVPFFFEETHRSTFGDGQSFPQRGAGGRHLRSSRSRSRDASRGSRWDGPSAVAAKDGNGCFFDDRTADYFCDACWSVVVHDDLMILAGRICGHEDAICHREGCDQELLEVGQVVFVIDVEDEEETVSDDSSDAARDEESMTVFRMKLAQHLAPKEEPGEDDRV